MTKILIIAAVLFLIIITGCQKKNTGNGASSLQTNDIISELIKENVLSGPSNTNEIDTNSEVSEPITEPVGSNGMTAANTTNEISSNMNIPVEPVTAMVKTNTAKQSRYMSRDQGVAAIEKEAPVENTGSQALFIEAGNDTSGQTLSPRNYIKITVVALVKDVSSAKYADIFVYAIPKGGGVNLSDNNLIIFGKDIDVINGQAQITKYWNGQNISTWFLAQGRYNIYVVYTIKNSGMEIIKKESRYWGMSDSAYLTLY